jgi:2,3-bisphosphoglycerate-dependent phosphoglycerate mutase
MDRSDKSVSKLVLIKHAMPILSGTMPSNEWILSDDGKEKSKRLAEYLKDYQMTNIYCSTEPKAIETASIAGDILEKEVVVTEQIHEHERTSNRKIFPIAEFHEKMRKFFRYPDVLIFGDETATIAKQRYLKAVQSIVDNEQDGNDIVIISHGTVMTLFVSHYNEVNQFDLWDSLGLPSIIELSLEDFSLQKVIPNLD